MATLNLQVAANGGDGYDYGTTFVNSGSNIYLGNDSTNQHRAFFNFLNVSIQHGSNIVSAKIQFYASASLSGSSCNLLIHCEAANNASVPSSHADLTGRPLTSGTAWSSVGSWTSGAWVESIDFSAELKEVIDRAGWSEGNAFTVHILNNASSSAAYRQCRAREYSTSLAAKVVVEYIAPQLADLSDQNGLSDAVNSFSLTDEINFDAGFGDASYGYDFKAAEEYKVGIGDVLHEYIESEKGLSDFIGIGEVISSEFEVHSLISGTSGVFDSADAFNWSEWLDQNLDKAVARYYCTITGAADGETDIEVPISSFQARKRNGYSTYLSVVIPGVAYADAISARANGEIVVEMAYLIDGIESLREEILRADLEQINIYEGTSSRSITLIGHQEQTFIAKESRLYDPVYRQLVDGELSFRFAVPDLWLNPGDTARVGDDAFTVDTVVYMVAGGGGQTVMEVQE